MVFKKVVLGVVGVSNSCSSSHVLFTVGIVSFILCQKINLIFLKKNCTLHVVFGEGISIISTW